MKTQLNTRQKGALGEKLIADWLTNAGFKIVDTNVQCRMGELDIVAIKNGVVSIIEVKSRRAVTGLIADMVPWRKQQRIINAAKYWQAHTPWASSYTIRFDVAIVEGNSLVEYIANAFSPSY